MRLWSPNRREERAVELEDGVAMAACPRWRAREIRTAERARGSGSRDGVEARLAMGEKLSVGVGQIGELCGAIFLLFWCSAPRAQREFRPWGGRGKSWRKRQGTRRIRQRLESV